jgi:two-component system chemotaxis response regulator CheB
MPRIKVLIVDDSALIRQLLRDILSADPEIEVVGAARDPYYAWERIKTTNPDVLTLDVEMPRMDGLTFLERLMRVHPIPVLMVSSLTEKGCETTLRAMELGAVDFITKPKVDVATGTVELADEITQKVKTVARARLRKRSAPTAPPTRLASTASLVKSTEKVIAIGASTGGTEALMEVLSALPADMPGIAIVQHMPPGFTTSFADRLNYFCQLRISEARDGDRLLPGHALLAPGGYHMAVRRDGAQYFVRVGMGEPVNRHRPSVDVLFNSCARHVGRNAIGVILTGMGGDGARGMLAMRQAGAHTIGQDEATCVVYGMPREAVSLGGVDDVVPLTSIAGRLVSRAHAMLQA